MVIGDKFVHIFRDVVPGFRAVVLSNGKRRSLVRCLCVARQKSKPTQSSSKSCSDEITEAHRDCTSDSSSARRDTLDLQLLYACRQIHQDASLLFWRTTQFCFDDGEPLTEFLDCLTELQQQNLRYLTIFMAINNLCTMFCRNQIELYWSACNAKGPEFYSLRKVEGLQLHLQIRNNKQQKLSTQESQIECIQECFEAVGDLCLLPLKTVEVSIRYAEPVKGRRKIPPTYRNVAMGDLEDIAQKMRKRLLQPASAQQPFAGSLAKRIKVLESSLHDLEIRARADEQTIALLDKIRMGSELQPGERFPYRRESHLKAEAVKERLGRLKAELHQYLHTGC